MSVKAFLARKNIVFSAKRYGVDALGAMAQGLFCTLLVGTILNTLGTQFHIGFLAATVVTIGSGDAATAYTIGGVGALAALWRCWSSPSSLLSAARPCPRRPRSTFW